LSSSEIFLSVAGLVAGFIDTIADRDSLRTRLSDLLASILANDIAHSILFNDSVRLIVATMAIAVVTVALDRLARR